MTFPAGPTQITQLLALARAGDEGALDRAYAAVYEELKQIARRQLRRERGTFETTVLVHEAYLKLVGGERPSPEDRNHLLALTARAMRQVLVDHARYVNALKRNCGSPTLTLQGDVHATSGHDAVEVLTVDDTIEALQKIDPRLARVVELRCFGGYEIAEIASIMELPDYTVRRDWRKARALLMAELEA
ncbi:MAG TPA: ECF-type sigma factor [Povalibacter sp.]|jgi:RNA polymerase sigma factor (TIGR02999 family)|nr:ECF-type sigma factor [Povalibacter sp.]